MNRCRSCAKAGCTKDQENMSSGTIVQPGGGTIRSHCSLQQSKPHLTSSGPAVGVVAISSSVGPVERHAAALLRQGVPYMTSCEGTDAPLNTKLLIGWPAQLLVVRAVWPRHAGKTYFDAMPAYCKCSPGTAHLSMVASADGLRLSTNAGSGAYAFSRPQIEDMTPPPVLRLQKPT